jgi:hypothetical protein
MVRRAWMSLGFVALFAAVLAGCKGLGDISATGSPPPTSASPSSSPTVSPAACNTMDPNSNVVIVGMGSQIGAVSTAPPYNNIAGYIVGNGSGIYSYTASLINQTSAATAITSSNVLQFVNIENSTTVYHSAVGFTGSDFPGTPYPFPSAAASPAGNAISSSSLWSTGRVPPNTTGSFCYSQVFTLKAGTYFFGDLDYYNITTFRDALIVSSTPDRARRRRP